MSLLCCSLLDVVAAVMYDAELDQLPELSLLFRASVCIKRGPWQSELGSRC